MPEVLGVSVAALGHLQTALLHTLWQGALIAAAVFFLLRRVEAKRPGLRYGVSVLGLLAVVLAALVTWCALGYRAEGRQAEASGEVLAQTAAADEAQVDAPVPDASPESPSSLGVGHGPIPHLSGSDHVLWCWLAGVAVMLLRVLRLMWGTRSLRKHAAPLSNPLVTAMLAELRTALGVSRDVVLLVTDELVSPVAMGLFWPAILLPASMATGLPPDQLRAVLAHELAHIRRYDYLVNFVQLMVEALLYFNPAVWWLSRQIRIEREACCDILAAGALGGVGDYAEALTRVARRVQEAAMIPHAAQGFGAEPERGSLLERLRRLLSPGYRPILRLRWYSLAAGVLVTLAILFGLYQSSSLGVSLAGWFLTDEERVETMAQLGEEHVAPWHASSTEREEVEVSGTIVTYDGKPLPEKKRFVGAISRVPRRTWHSYLPCEGSLFHGRVAAGRVHLTAEFPGYAPAVAGPFTVDEEHPIEEVELCLERSYPVAIRFVTPDGDPVPGVDFNGGYKYLKNRWSGTIHQVSDAAGCVQLEQAKNPIPVSATAKAHGYQESRRDDLLLAPDSTYDWVLQPDEPLEGIVVDRGTGAPIEGAEVALLFVRSRGWAGGGTEGELKAASGADGRFVLRGLLGGRLHYFVARAKGHGTEVFSLTPGHQEEPVRVALGQRFVQGIVRGDLDLLKRSRSEGRPVITYEMALELRSESHFHRQPPQEVHVTVVGDEGHFRIDDLRAGRLLLTAGSKTMGIEVQEPVEDLVIDLNESDEKAEREVVINLPVPKGAPQATGKLGFAVLDKARHSYGSICYTDVLDGRATFTVQAPGKIILYAERLDGYIPRPPSEEEVRTRRQGWEIPADSGSFVIDLPLERAGAIHGQVLRADGTPAGNALVSVRAESRANPEWPSAYGLQIGGNNPRCDEDGKFAALPLPLGETFVISASIGFAETEKKVKLSRWKSIANVRLRLPEGVDAPVRVLDPDGGPAPNMPLVVSWPGHTHSRMHADSEGCYIARGLDPGKDYSVQAQPPGHFQYVSAPIRLNGKETVIRLKKGLSVTGKVVMADSGKPMADISVEADPAFDPRTKQYRAYRVNTITNAEGKFLFTNLCEGVFKFRVGTYNTGVTVADVPGNPSQFTAGQKEPVIIRMRKREEGGE